MENNNYRPEIFELINSNEVPNWAWALFALLMIAAVPLALLI